MSKSQQRKSYTEIIQSAAREKYGPRRERKALKAATGYSYEHVRKVLGGEPVQSPAFNRALCDALGLDAESMWELAQLDKAHRRFGKRVSLTDSEEQRWVDLWHRLPHRNRSLASAVVEALSRD
jgi:hypothetical protein